MPFACRGKSAIRHLAPSPTLVPKHTSTPGLGPTFASSQNNLFRQFMQTYMEDCLNPTLLEVQKQEDALDRPLKTRNPDLYYRNSQIECYYFYQQCKDHFKIAGAKDHKHIPFAVSFLKDRIFFCWQ